MKGQSHSERSPSSNLLLSQADSDFWQILTSLTAANAAALKQALEKTQPRGHHSHAKAPRFYHSFYISDSHLNFRFFYVFQILALFMQITKIAFKTLRENWPGLEYTHLITGNFYRTKSINGRFGMNCDFSGKLCRVRSLPAQERFPAAGPEELNSHFYITTTQSFGTLKSPFRIRNPFCRLKLCLQSNQEQLLLFSNSAF